MRKLIVSEFMTLDGVIEDPGGGEETDVGGWSLQFEDTSGEQGKYKHDELMEADAQLLGRVTYEHFSKAWPSMEDESGFADKMNGMPKYVVTSTLDELEWNNSTPLKGNLEDEVRKLKEQPGGPILVGGSATLVQGRFPSSAPAI